VIRALISTLIFAAWEDIVFSGLIQPRLHGIVKNNILAVFIGALFFALMYMPFFFVGLGTSALSMLVSSTMVVCMGIGCLQFRHCGSVSDFFYNNHGYCSILGNISKPKKQENIGLEID